jgi:glycosyltransferase involved in cell wall biosynthesis
MYPLLDVRVLLITSQLSRNGGTAAHVLDSAECLASLGCAVAAIAGSSEGAGREWGSAIDEGPTIVEVPGVERSEVPATARRRVEEVLVQHEPDVIHIHDLLDVDWLLSLRKHAAIVWSVHNYFGCMTGDKYFKPGQECERPHGPGCIFNTVARGCDHRRVPRPSFKAYKRTGSLLRAVREADMGIVYSQFVRAQLETNGVRKVQVVPLFVRGQACIAAPARRRHVMFSGRVVTQKGVDVLLRAVAKRDDLIVHICGDGWGMGRMRRLAERLDATGCVRFEGWQSPAELARFYEMCDAVIVPSVWPEPFGLVGIEAMAHGRPVIGSNTGGIPEWLRHGQTGLLVRPGDATELSSALTWILDNPREAEEMGRAGAKDVSIRYSPAAFAAATTTAYEAAREAWARTELRSAARVIP